MTSLIFRIGTNFVGNCLCSLPFHQYSSLGATRSGEAIVQTLLISVRSFVLLRRDDPVLFDVLSLADVAARTDTLRVRTAIVIV